MATIENKSEKWLEHEVKLRVLEFQASDIYKRLEKLDHKIDTKLTWFYGVMIIPATLSILHSIGWL